MQRAERTLRAEADPMTAIVIRYVRALLELARGRDQEVLATFEAAERLSGLLDAPDWPLMRARALRLHALVRLGEFGRAEQDLAEIGEQGQLSGEIRMALAALRIAQGDPHAATVALAPVLSGAVPVAPATWLALACLLEAIARDALGDPAAARDALRRALDAATPDGVLATFLFHPPPGSCSIAMPRIAVTRPPWWPRSVTCSPPNHPRTTRRTTRRTKARGA